MAAVKPSLNTDPVARKWHVYTDLTTAAIDLTATTFGPGTPARAIVAMSAGVLVVVKPDDGVETTPTLASGFQLNGQVKTIKKASDGTTVTAVIVYW